jgi:hypothetical protein
VNLASSPPDTEVGEVFDPIDGRLVAGNLAAFCKSLERLLPSVPDDCASESGRFLTCLKMVRAPAVDPRVFAWRLDGNEIEGEELEDARGNGEKPELGLRFPTDGPGFREALADPSKVPEAIAAYRDLANQGMHVRHAFARASAAAHALAAALHRRGHHDKSLQYFAIGQALNQLKAMHLNGAAAQELSAHVGQWCRKLGKVAPGIPNHWPNSTVTTSQSLKLGGNAGFVNITVGVDKLDVLTVDETFDIEFWHQVGASAKVGVGLRFRRWLAQFFGSGSVDITPKDCWFEKDELDETLRLVTRVDANLSLRQSAGPKAQAFWNEVNEARDRAQKFFVGRGYVPPGAGPNYLGDKKLEKGANTKPLEILGEILDDMDDDKESKRFSRLFGRAYPPMHVALDRQRDPEKPPTWMLDEILPTPHLAGRFTRPNAVAGAQVKVPGGRPVTGGPNNLPILDGCATFEATGKYDRQHFAERYDNMSHQMLTAGAMHDMAMSVELHRMLEKLVDPRHPEREREPRLHLYHAVARHVSPDAFEAGDPEKKPTLDRIPAARDLYGAAVEESGQFMDTLLHPSTKKLRQVEDVCAGLQGVYKALVEHGRSLVQHKRRSDRNSKDRSREKLEACRRSDYEALNREIWGNRYPGGFEAARKNFRRFVAESLDAVSLALANAEAHLHMLTGQLVDKRGLTDEERALIVRAKAYFRDTRDMIQTAALPMARPSQLQHTLFKTRSLLSRHNAIGTVTVKAGQSFDPVGASEIAGGLDTPPVSSANSLGAVNVTAQFQYLYTNHHPNASRTGHFLQFSLNVTSGPLLGEAIEQAAEAIMEKLFPGVEHAELRAQAGPRLRQQLKEVAFNADNGRGVTIRLRKAPGAKHFDLQRVYASQLRDGGIDASGDAGPVAFEITNADNVQTTDVQVLGPDLGVLNMWYQTLKITILDKEVPEDAEDAEDAEDSGGAEGEAGQDGEKRERQKLIDQFTRNPFMKNAFFGNPTMITTVLERLDQWEIHANKQDKDKTAAERREDYQPNEFFRFFNQQPFRRAGHALLNTSRFAPDTKNSFARVLEREIKPRWNLEDDRANEREYHKAMRTVGEMKTADERMEYFCNEGRPLWDRFVSAIAKTREMSASVMYHLEDPKRPDGFHTSLRNPKHAYRAKWNHAPTPGFWSTLRSNHWPTPFEKLQRMDTEMLMEKDKRLGKQGGTTTNAAMKIDIQARLNAMEIGKPSEDTIFGKATARDDSLRPPRLAWLESSPAADGDRRNSESSDSWSDLSGISKRRSRSASTSGSNRSATRQPNLPERYADTLYPGWQPHAKAQPLPSKPSSGSHAAGDATRRVLEELRDRQLGMEIELELPPKVDPGLATQWLRDRGMRLVEGPGTGLRNLVTAMVRHATGRYEEGHEDVARTLIDRMRDQGRSVGNEAPTPGSDAFEWIVDALNQHFQGGRPERRLSVNVLGPARAAHGAPTLQYQAPGGGREVILLDLGGGRYSAVVPDPENSNRSTNPIGQPGSSSKA